MKKMALVGAVVALVGLASCSHEHYKARFISSDSKRGNPWDYDPGASLDSKWPELFADTPNYRAFGKEVINAKRGEKFRWKFGPMWYRGRLQPQRVKVFVIGQEGAQDENVSNRSFTGSTGTRMQKFLNYFGINQSYLFMNTFVYTITGQYGLFGEDAKDPVKVKALEQLKWLAQSEDSIVVQHRHKLFDYMLETNDDTLSLVIGVGTAGKDSTATWFRHHGANCTSSKLGSSYCEGSGKLKGVIAIGVRHPGAASDRNGGAGAAGGLITDFRKKADIVAKKIKANDGWLPLDPGGKRNFEKQFVYGYAPIPHRDFPFGTNWNMGRRGTTSNRRGSDTIQVFSDKGCYNNGARAVETYNAETGKIERSGRCSQTEKAKVKYKRPTDRLKSAPADMSKGALASGIRADVPYESPKSTNLVKEYDMGPGKYAKDMIMFYDQNYWAQGVTTAKSWGPQGIYRGRFEKAKVLVLSDQLSHDDMFSGRALTGEGGQRVQTFLNAMGANDSYAIIRTLPVDTVDLSVQKQTEIALSEGVFESRLRLINRALVDGDTEVILAVGPVAQAVANQLEFSVPVIELETPDKRTHKKQWNAQLKRIKSLKLELDSKGSFSYNGKETIIPRKDLPAYTRWWMGTSGSRAARAYQIFDGKKVYDGDYYKVHAPRWATKWKSLGLIPEETNSFKYFKDKSGLY